MHVKRFVFAFLSFFIFIAVLSVPLHVLQIKALREGRVVYLERIFPDFKFSLGFLHSVEHCPVWDYLKVDGNYRLITYATAFWSSRTGQPYAAFGNETFRIEGDHFVIENMHRVIPAVNQWVEAKYNNTMRFDDGREVKLAALAGSTLLQITTEKVRLWYYIYHEVKLYLGRGAHYGK